MVRHALHLLWFSMKSPSQAACNKFKMTFMISGHDRLLYMQHVNTLEEALSAVEQLLQNHLQST